MGGASVLTDFSQAHGLHSQHTQPRGCKGSRGSDLETKLQGSAIPPLAHCGHLSKCGGTALRIECSIWSQGFILRQPRALQQRAVVLSGLETESLLRCWRDKRGIRGNLWAGTTLITIITFNISNNRFTVILFSQSNSHNVLLK